MTTLTIDHLEKWYKKRLADKSKDFVKQAERSYKTVEIGLKEVQAIAESLKEASLEEEEDSEGIATRFAMKITEIADNFDVKKTITYESTEALQTEIGSFIRDIYGAGQRWIGRMDKKHKSSIKSLDMYIKELQLEMKKLGKLLYDFSWLKDVERIEGRIQSLRELTLAREIFEERLRQNRLKIDSAKKEHSSAKQVYDQFRQSSNVAELLSLDEESERVSSILRMKLNPLKKQVKTYLQTETGIRVGPAGQKALIDYFENPLVSITAEPDGYPGLVEGLEGLRQALQDGKLALKDRLERRAIEEIEDIRNGSLHDLQSQAKSIDERRRAFAGSEVYERNAELASRLEEANKNLEYHKNDLLKIRDEITKQLDKIKESKTRIESDLLSAFSEPVVIDVGTTLEPLLDKCRIE
jgi:hypothetical protein